MCALLAQVSTLSGQCNLNEYTAAYTNDSVTAGATYSGFFELLLAPRILYALDWFCSDLIEYLTNFIGI